MNLDRHTALGLGLAFISLFLVVGGVGASLVTGLRVLRLLGLTIGGTAAIPTLLLCLYYLAILKIRTRGVTIATVGSGTVAFVFVLFMVALFSGHPTLHRWATYAF